MTHLLGDRSSAKSPPLPQGESICVWMSRPETVTSLPPGEAQELLYSGVGWAGELGLQEILKGRVMGEEGRPQS